MKARLVRIGNSYGIHLPKKLLQEAQLEDEVELGPSLPYPDFKNGQVAHRLGRSCPTYAGTGRRSPHRPTNTDSIRQGGMEANTRWSQTDSNKQIVR
ncbi:MAG: AbrB/MazE/SpoVT family DNA-binding domain-containing protein [Nitrospirota bacterium]|nr:AbrB/MazE/SpoVT family DNA-binding domain-containing protein [Nitrospirota bacterium]